MLEAKGFSVTVADARFAKPLDADLINQLASSHSTLVTVEEGSQNGFGSIVRSTSLITGLLDGGKLKVRTLTLPTAFRTTTPRTASIMKPALPPSTSA